MVKFLEKAVNEYEDDSGIQTMKGEMLKLKPGSMILKSQNYYLRIFTCLDPRFKNNFLKEAKRLAKKYVIETVVDTNVEVEPQSKRPHTESSSNSAAGNASKFGNVLRKFYRTVEQP